MTLVARPAPPVVRPAATVTSHDEAVPLPAIDLPVGDVAPVSCTALDAIGDTLAADPATVAALTPLATQAAPAIMAWNGDWSPDPAVLPIRRVVTAVVAAAPVSCRNDIKIGPRLFFVSVTVTKVAIAIGSGRWAWNDLLSEDKDRTLP